MNDKQQIIDAVLRQSFSDGRFKQAVFMAMQGLCTKYSDTNFTKTSDEISDGALIIATKTLVAIEVERERLWPVVDESDYPDDLKTF